MQKCWHEFHTEIIKTMANKLWEKNVEVNEKIDRFTVGRDRELDLHLAKYDVMGSMAHIIMLESIGLLEKNELEQLLRELRNIHDMAQRGEFVIEDDVEDVHSQVELLLTRKLGDMGKKIHSGRSRNDQVLVDLQLFTRDRIMEIADKVMGLFSTLQRQSEKYKDILMPGYTHLQVAMPSSFGLWFGAYAESLTDDMLFLHGEPQPAGFSGWLRFILSAKPHHDHTPAGLPVHELQCCLCADGPGKDRTQRMFCPCRCGRNVGQDGV